MLQFIANVVPPLPTPALVLPGPYTFFPACPLAVVVTCLLLLVIAPVLAMPVVLLIPVTINVLPRAVGPEIAALPFSSR